MQLNPCTGKYETPLSQVNINGIMISNLLLD